MLRYPGLRGFPTDVVWSGGHDVAHLALSLTSFLLLQRALAPAEYGAYFGLYGLIGIIGALTVSALAFAALQHLIGDADRREAVMGSFLTLGVASGAVASIVIIVVGSLTLSLPTSSIVPLAIAEMLAAGVIALLSVLVHAQAGYPAAIRVRLVVVLLRLAVVVGLYAAGLLTIRNLGVGILIVFSAYALLLAVVIVPRSGCRPAFGRPSGESVRLSALYAAPAGASKVQTDGDKYLLNVFRFPVDAGVYGAAYRVVQMATLPLQAIESAAFHRFLPSAETDAATDHVQRARIFFRLMLAASMFVAVALFLAVPLLDGLFEEQYDEALDIVPWLILVIPLAGTNSVPLNALLGLGRADVRMGVYVAAAVVTLVLYVALIPTFSWRGAVAATFVGELFLLVAGWIAVYLLRHRDAGALGREPSADAGATQ